MKKEINAAVKFIIKLIKQNSNLNEMDLLQFQQCFKLFLAQKFNNHWHPERPWKGQGYRCLRINGTNGKEPTIDKAASECGLNYSDLKLPLELTVWVDPEEVCCRFGEHKGSYCTVASFQKGKENQCKDVNCIEGGKADSTKENNNKDPLKRLNASPKTALSPGRKVSRREKVPPPTNHLRDSNSSSSSPSSRGTKKAFGSTPSLALAEQTFKSSYFNPSDSASSSCFYDSSSSQWIGYPVSVSPPFASTTYYNNSNNNGTSYSPRHFSSQDNLNLTRISPVNFTKLRWASGDAYTCPKNGWYVPRQQQLV